MEGDSNKPDQPWDASRETLESFAGRLREVVGEYKSANALAKAAGVSQSGMQKWLTGVSEPGRDKLVALAKAAGVSVEWLATGQGPKESTQGASDFLTGPDELGGDYILIPLYDQAASAGAGALALDVNGEGDRAPVGAESRLAFLKAWLRGRKGLHPAKLFLLTVAGDSMEPTLSQGDVVLVDRSAKRVTTDGLYIVRIDNSLLVKRVQALPGGMLELTSDNQAYKPFTLRSEDEGQDVAIIGRVVWVGKEV